MNRDNRVTTIYGIAILGVGSALFIPVISGGSSLSRDLLLTIRARRIWQPSIHRGRLARAIDPRSGTCRAFKISFCRASGLGRRGFSSHPRGSRQSRLNVVCGWVSVAPKTARGHCSVSRHRMI
jgi:hypothetical protein